MDVEAPCGPKPIIGWNDLEGVKEFADMLLGFYGNRKAERNKIKEASDNLLRQALAGRESLGEEFF